MNHFDDFDYSLLAALVYLRFGEDHEQARAAWSRMLQNHGWDDDPLARKEWAEQVIKGLRALRECGLLMDQSHHFGWSN